MAELPDASVPDSPTFRTAPEIEGGITRSLREAGSARVVFGRFRLERELGEGGMGVVWLARDERLDLRLTALKFLPGLVARDAGAINDLRREIRHGLDINHPGIVRVYDLHESREERLAAIAMEYVDGPTLAALKAEQPDHCFDCRVVLPWLRALCEILDYLHGEIGMVHRDLKSGNLMLNSRGRLKLADFGIAAAISESHSRLSQARPSSASGTPAYMSPQQALGKLARPSDDIYALGATFFDLLAGKPPFYRGGAASVLYQLQHEAPPSIEERRAELNVKGRTPVSGAWAAAIAACLAKHPADRPHSGAAILALLETADCAPPLLHPGVSPGPQAAISSEAAEPLLGPSLKVETDRGEANSASLSPMSAAATGLASVSEIERTAAPEFPTLTAVEQPSPSFEPVPDVHAPTLVESAPPAVEEAAPEAAASDAISVPRPENADSQGSTVARPARPVRRVLIAAGLAVALGGAAQIWQLSRVHPPSSPGPPRPPGLASTSEISSAGAPARLRAEAARAFQQQDFARAFTLDSEAGADGDPATLFRLGYMHATGQGTPENFALARSCFETAAAAGSAPAAAHLGWMCETGAGAPADLARAITYYTQAAAQSEPLAQNNLASLLANGRGVPKDLPQAVRLYEKAREQGAATAIANLGRLTRDGQGVPQDDKKAFDLFQEAHDLGNAGATLNLGECYASGGGVAQDERRAVELFEEAAKAGHPDAQFRLALALETGGGIAPDAARAVDLYEEAAKSGLATAQNNLGHILELRATPQDLQRAASLYRQAAAAGLPRAQYNLARCQESGIGVAADAGEAQRLYENAADAGDQPAQCDLAYRYALGKGVEKNEVRALELYRKLAATGYPAAIRAMIVFHQRGFGGVAPSKTQADEWQRRLADLSASAGKPAGITPITP